MWCCENLRNYFFFGCLDFEEVASLYKIKCVGDFVVVLVLSNASAE
jgi:hypothetical protein